jgi:transglutaminase-like putative cysteine protease
VRPPDRAEPRWANAAALVLLSAAAAAAWWASLGSGVLWLAPIVAIAALTAAGVLNVRVAATVAVAWLPVALLAAGLPLGTLAPGALRGSVESLRQGLQALPSLPAPPRPLRGDTPVDTWALAAVLLCAGTGINLAGILWRGSGGDRVLAGFVLLVAPLVAAIALGQTSDAAWQGAIVLAAAILRIARGRAAPALVAVALIAGVAVVGAQAAAPRDGWRLFADTHLQPQFEQLDTAQSYGPLQDRRSGAVMLEIRAPRPQLWRMQVLDDFDGSHWLVTHRAMRLPEPAAEREAIRVEVRGLADKLIVSPGRTVAVRGGGPTTGIPGAALALDDPPQEGDAYVVEADVVNASAAELAAIPIPRGPLYNHFTRIWTDPPPVPIPRPVARLANDMPDALRGTPWARLLSLAWRLSAGETSELAVVRRVEDYLLQGGRFRYTTDVAEPSAEPLLDFLFTTHAGYCQHFAGAAALLLRLAGVPTRVVAGFATGVPSGPNAWAVRDEDAHAWIEVYFPGVGWVPFNPTPSVAPADVAAGLDVLRVNRAGAGGSGGLAVVLGAGAAVLAILAFVVRRGRRGRRDPAAELCEVLARLVPEAARAGTTLRELRPALVEIGPRTEALALVAERARFAADPSRAEHPRQAVWRALVADVGLRRAAALALRAAGSR